MRTGKRQRRGVVLVEAGIVYSVALMLILGAIVVGLGIFRYNQVAWLAREGARWAAVRGALYQSENTQSAPTAASVMANAVTPRSVAMKSSNLTATLTWNTTTTPPSVTFRLDYQWVPETLLPAMTFTSTSSQVVMY